MMQNDYIQLEDKFGAHNYHPIPVVLERGEGVFVYDTDGKQYFDFLSAYSAVNQGHSHPRIINALIQQAKKFTLSSRAFYNNQLGIYEEFITRYFKYDKVLPMNTGVEAVETAVKLCRKWAYEKKGIPENKAKIVVLEGNFHGRTITAISASNDPSSYKGFGPLLPGIIRIPYNDIESFKNIVSDPEIAGFLIEPIQGEAGVVVPSDQYLQECFSLCKRNNILFIADEIQTGIARTGKMLACDYVNVRPDILILGKALSGGVLPVSAVLADDEIMLCIRPGEHGSTFGGNPLACAVATEALRVVVDEDLCQKALESGLYFRKMMTDLSQRYPIIELVRGKGLLNAIVLRKDNNLAWDLCMKFAENGVLAKPTHGHIIRLAPPLVINKEQLEIVAGLIEKSLKQVS
ncbi:MAG: ornithine--oxo-acid transaminase [Saprospiraceae bacterium]|nr:ornithine--oxo-acid transaminase [Saprospiraceae bacterium]